LNDGIKCKECGGRLVISDHGELVCSNCGLVNDKIYLPPLFEIEPLSDFSAPNRVYVSPDGKPIKDGWLGSVIIGFRDLSNRVEDSEKILKFMRLSSLHHLSSIAPYKSLLGALCSLRRACSNLGVPKHVFHRASYIYLKAMKQAKKFGSSYRIAAASLLLAVRELGYPVTLKEIVDAFSKMGHRVVARTLLKTAFLISRKLNIDWKFSAIGNYIPRVINELKNNERIIEKLRENKINQEHYFNELIKLSYKISNILSKHIKMGKNPYLMAVSIVYTADKVIAQQHGYKPVLSQKALAMSLKTTEYTIRQHFKIISKELGIKCSSLLN